MGNTVSAHICHIKGDPTLLYCIDSDWTPLSIGGKKLVSLGTSKFGVLGGKATVLVCMHDKFPI